MEYLARPMTLQNVMEFLLKLCKEFQVKKELIDDDKFCDKIGKFYIL